MTQNESEHETRQRLSGKVCQPFVPFKVLVPLAKILELAMRSFYFDAYKLHHKKGIEDGQKNGVFSFDTFCFRSLVPFERKRKIKFSFYL